MRVSKTKFEKKIFSTVLSHDLYWENKTYQLKRSIGIIRVRIFFRSARKKKPSYEKYSTICMYDLFFPTRKAIRKVWTVIAQNWNKSFTHIEHRVGAVGREDLVNWIPVLAPEYLLPSQWISVLAPTFHFRHGPNTCSPCAKLWHRTYPICDSSL